LDDGRNFSRVDLSLEHQMKAEKQNILLQIDNCWAHKNVPWHSEITKVASLPPDGTSIL
jgi:hypothetical protein